MRSNGLHSRLRPGPTGSTSSGSEQTKGIPSRYTVVSPARERVARKLILDLQVEDLQLEPLTTVAELPVVVHGTQAKLWPTISTQDS